MSFPGRSLERAPAGTADVAPCPVSGPQHVLSAFDLRALLKVVALAPHPRAPAVAVSALSPEGCVRFCCGG